MADIDFSLLDVPRSAPVDDPEAYLRAAIAWHFGEETGCAFWLRAAKTLDFNPLTEVNTFADLRLFPNLLSELRTEPVEDLIPRGYGFPPPVPQIFESGGTTGAPKRTVQLPDWVEQIVEWQTEDFAGGGFLRGHGFLCMMPSGPHGVGYFSRQVSEQLGSVFHAIDLDPRWVKKIAARNATAEVTAYVDHLVEQAVYILQTQHVANLHTTPPLLEAIARDDDVVKLVNEKIRFMLLSGAHLDVDTLDLLRDIFPHTTITMAFGSTMILSQAITRRDDSDDRFVFHPRSPYATFWVVDPDTGDEVPHGQRGQVVMNHISKGMFLPNNLERDSAIRMPGLPGQVGDSLSEVRPVAAFEGEPVIEGVYFEMLAIDALGPDGTYRSRIRELITTTAGVAVADLSIAPPLYVSRAVSAQRNARPLPMHEREAALAKAADVFTSEVVAGLDFDTYVMLASRISGVPISVTRSAAHSVADGVASAFGAARPARPTGAVFDWRDERTRHGGAVWARRGEVFAVLASGNGPGVHRLWPQALALGYRVAVRPSRREPLTAYRLVHALRQAGFRPPDAVYLPCDHRGADELVRSADLAMVYGGQGVVDKYAGDPTVFVNGPGRSKILITPDHDWRDYLDVITDSIANLGGVACVNATAVLYEGDPAPLAEAIAEQLSRIDALPTDDERAILPTQNLDEATALASHLATVAAGTTPLLGADQVVAALSESWAALRPAVHLLAKPDVAKLNVELPFPCVWVSPWSRADGLAPLRHSLVISAITDDDDLIDDLLAEPTIANVYGGHHPTHHSAPDIPHDGFLADFLMRTKGFIRD